jgi:hypothetical protein
MRYDSDGRDDVMHRLSTLLAAVALLLSVGCIVLWVRQRDATDTFDWRSRDHDADGVRRTQFFWEAYSADGRVRITRCAYDSIGDDAFPDQPDGLSHRWADPAASSATVSPQFASPFYQVTRFGADVFGVTLASHAPKTLLDHRERCVAVSISLWVAAPMLAAVPLMWVVRHPGNTRRRRAANGLCLRCGYDLRATAGRCPECGAAVEVRA